MKVYLLPLDSGRLVFYSERRDTPAEAGKGAPQRGLRGWIERMSRWGAKPSPCAGNAPLDREVDQALNAAWNEAGPGKPAEGVTGRLRRAWDWLQRRLAPDEAMLKRLARASRIQVHHPASMETSEVQRLWREYLARRRRRHWFWLVVTLLVAPLTVLLTIVPGPNVIGYWFVYRAICHLRVVLGTRRALGARVPTNFHLTTALEPAPGLSEEEWIARISRRYRLRELGSFLERAATELEDAVPVACAGGPAGPGNAPAGPVHRVP